MKIFALWGKTIALAESWKTRNWPVRRGSSDEQQAPKAETQRQPRLFAGPVPRHLHGLLSLLVLSFLLFWVTHLLGLVDSQPGTWRGPEGMRCKLNCASVGWGLWGPKPTYFTMLLGLRPGHSCGENGDSMVVDLGPHGGPTNSLAAPLKQYFMSPRLVFNPQMESRRASAHRVAEKMKRDLERAPHTCSLSEGADSRNQSWWQILGVYSCGWTRKSQT